MIGTEPSAISAAAASSRLGNRGPLEKHRAAAGRPAAVRDSAEWFCAHGSGNLTSTQVRDIARAATDTTGNQNSVLVTEALSRAWVGLAALTTV